MPPSRHHITPITGAGRTIQRTVRAHIPRVVGANKAEKEGIPALAAVSQSEATLRPSISVHRSETQSAMLGAMVAPMGGGGGVIG
ncbi:hypothetical protein V502_05284 [Pseudogymnoascus sp. VKM F-4520 (FW-2644)]|nr:hypothetical protein V502_05284 [Pseudogymnoascus sp. VKM F-4520 (FW-2644)]